MISLVILAAVALGVVRLVRGRGEPGSPTDASDVSVRRLFVYVLLFAALVLVAIGISDLLQEALREGPLTARGRNAVARSLAFLIVGTPAFAGLIVHARRTLEGDQIERRARGWALYLNAVLAVSLTTAMIGAHSLGTEWAVGTLDRNAAADLVPLTTVWATVWAAHWVLGLGRYGVRGDAHLAYGTVAGMWTFAAGIGGVLLVGLGRVYEVVADSPYLVNRASAPSRELVTVLVGAVVWGWYWFRNYRPAKRTDLWHVVVVLLGALAGLAASIGAAATALYSTLVWFLGDPGDDTASVHFEVLPEAAAVAILGLAAWRYHRAVLGPPSQRVRTDPFRAYDYLSAGAGLVAVVSGVAIVVVAIIEAVSPARLASFDAPQNTLLAAVTMIVVGGPVWWIFWQRIALAVSADPANEHRSPVRRVYLASLFGVGGAVVMISLVGVLYSAINDMLEGIFGRESVYDSRAGITIVVSVTGVAWYHLRIWRTETDARREAIEERGPELRRVVVVVADDGTSARSLREHIVRVEPERRRVRVEWWRPADGTPVPTGSFDAASVLSDAAAAGSTDVLVLNGVDGVSVLPFVDEGA